MKGVFLALYVFVSLLFASENLVRGGVDQSQLVSDMPFVISFNGHRVHEICGMNLQDLHSDPGRSQIFV